MSPNVRRSSSLVVVVAVLLAGVGVGGCARNEAAPRPVTPTAAEVGKAPVLVNITGGRRDLHAVSMGLELARGAAERGHRTVVLLNVDAPVFATRDLGRDVKFEDMPPVAQMLRDILARGGKVVVCGHCASILNLRPESMMEGVVLARGGELLEMLEPGMVSLSY